MRSAFLKVAIVAAVTVSLSAVGPVAASATEVFVVADPPLVPLAEGAGLSPQAARDAAGLKDDDD